MAEKIMAEKIHNSMQKSTMQKRDAKGEIRHGGEWLALWSDPKSMQSAAERRQTAAAEQALDGTRLAIAATLRSLAQQPQLNVRYSGKASDGVTVCLSSPVKGKADKAALRGEADANASLLRYHNRELHARLRPSQAETARLFDLLEQRRCEGLMARNMAGVADNLSAYQVVRLTRADLMNAHLASLIPLSEGLSMVLRDQFTGAVRPSVQTAGMRMWDQWLRARYTSQLDQLAASLSSQNDYAALAKRFLEALLVELSPEVRRRRRANAKAAEPDGQSPDPQLRSDSDDPSQANLFEPGDESDHALAAPGSNLSATMTPAPTAYRAYTSRHDRIVNAETLFDRGLLAQSRRKLDEKQAAYRQDMLRLTARLQRRLLAQQARRWEFDMDEGLIDASRLDRIVTSPGFISAYKQERQSLFRDTLVTLLIDNSGSMRGKAIETACVAADLLAAVLERCGIAVEILGFTTRQWKGGLAAKDWKQAGRPEDPGRLNDLLHIIYKEADKPLRRARDALCAMLEAALLKENIDGEALLWAAGRALQRPEARRMLIVISDGAAVDEATLEANTQKDILDRHLREVIRWIDQSTPIDLAAIGIKHPVASHYRNSVQIDALSDLGPAMIDLLDRGLAEKRA